MKNHQFVFPFVGVLFLATTIWASAIDPHHFVTNQNCKCYNDDCGCCEYIDWSSAGINGTVCTNFSYLPKDYGISVTITWNTYTLFNETVSARNPPPFCFGIPELEKIQAHICLRLYDLTFADKRFHGCGKVWISVYHIIHKSMNLGCFDIPKESLEKAYATESRRVLEIMRDVLENLEFWKKDSPVANMI